MNTPIEAQLRYLGQWFPAELTKGSLTGGRPMVVVAGDETLRGPGDVFAIRAYEDTDNELLEAARAEGFTVLDVE